MKNWDSGPPKHENASPKGAREGPEGPQEVPSLPEWAPGVLPGASTGALRLPFCHFGVAFEAKRGDLGAFLSKILSQKRIENEKWKMKKKSEFKKIIENPWFFNGF